ncbi:MAG TPA: redox-regulated ATPase YchF [archaeon]|nr:redox-regulated ATPase YchF [archaeon]
MLLAVTGKPNSGKTTFFSAATLVDAEISSRVFTTIKPNRGITYVRTECPCKAGKKCNPKNSKCIDGIRLVPVQLIDTAGLVPDAHKGRGLGNQFLSDIMLADALIHVVDISGSSDADGNIVEAGSHDPKKDIEFLEKEIDFWMLSLLNKIMMKRASMSREEFLDDIANQFTGLGIDKNISGKLAEGLTQKSSEEELMNFIAALREASKPMLIAANKADIKGSEEIMQKISVSKKIIPCCAEAELALRRADERGIIKYVPGSSDFEIMKEKRMTSEGRIEALDEKHKKALEFIKELLQKHGSTGIQKVIDTAVFSLLETIVVYPVENEHKWSDKKGNVLPDAFLMRSGSTALDLAYKIHEDIGKKFISAVDARTGRHIAGNYVLKDGDIISIKSGR